MADEDILIQELSRDQIEIDLLTNEMTQLSNSSLAIEKFGLNPTALGVLQTTGLLNGTALDKVGLESFHFDSPEGPESQMALESLSEKIKETAARWSAKILSMVKNGNSKVLDILNKLWSKLSAKFSLLTDKIKNATGEAVAYTKAHPYKVVIGTLVAIAAVTGVIMYTGSNLPGAGATRESIFTFQKKIQSMINGIHWPFGKVEATIDNSQKLLVHVIPDPNMKLLTHMTGPGSPSYKDPIMEQVNAWSASQVHEVVEKTTSFFDHFQNGLSNFFRTVFGLMDKLDSFSKKTAYGIADSLNKKHMNVLDNPLASPKQMTKAAKKILSNENKAFYGSAVFSGISTYFVMLSFFSSIFFLIGLVLKGLRYIYNTIKDLLVTPSPKPQKA